MFVPTAFQQHGLITGRGAVWGTLTHQPAHLILCWLPGKHCKGHWQPINQQWQGRSTGNAAVQSTAEAADSCSWACLVLASAACQQDAANDGQCVM